MIQATNATMLLLLLLLLYVDVSQTVYFCQDTSMMCTSMQYT